MFTAKKDRLSTRPVSSGGKRPPFVAAGLKESSFGRSGNNALKHLTTGDPFVDQFGKLGSYKKPRNFSEIASDCETLWGVSKLKSILFLFYIRIINRVTILLTGEKTHDPQKGGELRYEGIMRMIWLSQKSPETFWKNLGIFISIGSWKDIIMMLQYDLTHHGWEARVLPWDQMGELLLSGLEQESQVNLIKKYLPQIKAQSHCTTVEAEADNMIAKWICSLLYGNKPDNVSDHRFYGHTYKLYRKLKTSGTAHEWQQLISQKKFDRINFNRISGRALNLLVRSKFLKRQGLSERYEEWAKKEEVIKYTGFVHELFSNLPPSLVGLSQGEQETINKQFKMLIDKGGESEQTRLMPVRDTSGSMSSLATGTTMRCGDIAKALALYFSEFLKGEFQGSWIEFNRNATMHMWNGTTPLQKWYNDHSSFVGNTDFQSVIELFCKLKKEIDEENFPTGILCISDGEFDPSDLEKTNVQTAKKKLTNAGFSKEYVDNFVIILWNLQSRHYGKGTGEKFETFGAVPNVFYFSGYSAAVILFLTSKIRTAEELVDAALDQEVLRMITL